MKKILSFLTFMIFVGVLFFTTDITSHSAAPPSGSAGDPGAGGATCTQGGCHSGNPIADSSQFTLAMDTAQFATQTPVFSHISTYIPGKTYYVSFTGNSASAPRFGFQLIAEGVNTAAAGSFTVTDAMHTQLQSGGYMGHKSASSYKTWTFKWTAPATNIGDVTFYCAAMNSNNDGTSNGDVVYNFAKVLKPQAALPPVAAFSASPLTGTTTTTFHLTDASTNTPTNWNWSFSPPTIIYTGGTSATSQNPQLIFSSAGTYSVKLKVLNAAGRDSLTKTNYITVTNPNGINDINPYISALDAYPVPMSAQMNVSFDLKESAEMTINLLSIDGSTVKTLYNDKAISGAFKHSFDVSDLALGIYILQIKTPHTYINRQVIKL